MQSVESFNRRSVILRNWVPVKCSDASLPDQNWKARRVHFALLWMHAATNSAMAAGYRRHPGFPCKSSQCAPPMLTGPKAFHTP